MENTIKEFLYHRYFYFGTHYRNKLISYVYVKNGIFKDIDTQEGESIWVKIDKSNPKHLDKLFEDNPSNFFVREKHLK